MGHESHICVWIVLAQDLVRNNETRQRPACHACTSQTPAIRLQGVKHTQRLRPVAAASVLRQQTKGQAFRKQPADLCVLCRSCPEQGRDCRLRRAGAAAAAHLGQSRRWQRTSSPRRPEAERGPPQAGAGSQWAHTPARSQACVVSHEGSPASRETTEMAHGHCKTPSEGSNSHVGLRQLQMSLPALL